MLLSVLLMSMVAQIVPIAHAYIPVKSSQSGAEVRWNQGAELLFRVNETNRTGLSANSIFNIFTTSLNRWKQAAFGGFNFLYYQGTDTARYPNYRASGDGNAIFFTSNAGSGEQLPCGTIGLTEVWFESGGGRISRIDMRFNDVCYNLTTNANDTGSGNSRVYLGDVATHELGHALGLDHSQNAQSTMVYTAALGMATPSCDDQAAMIHSYAPSVANQTGTLSGRVLTPSGMALFGAHVTAVNLDTGATAASALTGRDGIFNISSLEPGSYTAVVEPYYPGAGTLGPYYSSVQTAVCPSGAVFQRTFLSNGGLAQSFDVYAGGSAYVPDTTVSCTAPGSLNGTAETSRSTAPQLTAANLVDPIATQGVFSSSASGDHYYLLRNQSGYLEAHANSFSIFSRADVQVEFLNSTGTRISTQSASGNTYASAQSSYVNYDARASVTLATTQDVYMHVFTRATLPNAAFPAGSTGVSSTAYYVASVSRGATPQFYASNANCESADNFSAYVSQGDAPVVSNRGGGDTSDADSSSSSGCGTIQDISGGGSGGPGSQVRMINFLVLMGILAFMHRKLKDKTVIVKY